MALRRLLGLLGFRLGAVPDEGGRVAFIRHEQRRVQRCCQQRSVKRDGYEFAPLVAGAFPRRAKFDVTGRGLGGDAVVWLLGARLAGGLDVHRAEAEAQGEDVTREGVGFLVVAEVTNNHVRLLKLRDRHDDDLVGPVSAAAETENGNETNSKRPLNFFSCVPEGRAKRVASRRCNMGQHHQVVVGGGRAE